MKKREKYDQLYASDTKKNTEQARMLQCLSPFRNI